jgi:hypothetical protein
VLDVWIRSKKVKNVLSLLCFFKGAEKGLVLVFFRGF